MYYVIFQHHRGGALLRNLCYPVTSVAMEIILKAKRIGTSGVWLVVSSSRTAISLRRGDMLV